MTPDEIREAIFNVGVVDTLLKIKEERFLRFTNEFKNEELTQEEYFSIIQNLDFLNTELSNQDDLDKLGKDLFSLQDRLRLTEKDRMEARSALEKTKKNLEEESRLKVDQANRARDLAARRAEAEARLAMLSKEFEDRGVQLSQKDATAKELMAKKNDLEKKMSVVEARKIDAEGKVLALSRELEDRGALLAKKDASAKELMAEKADLEKRMNTVAGRAAEAEKALADAAAAARDAGRYTLADAHRRRKGAASIDPEMVKILAAHLRDMPKPDRGC